MTNKICHHLVFFIFSLLLLWIKTTNSTSVSHRLVPAAAQYNCTDKERDALLDFKAHIQDPYSDLSTWKTDKEEDCECCKWDGVTCNNQTGHVTQLDLSYNGFGGMISPYLLNLSYLSYLNLAGNSFSGTIPVSIGSLTRLTYLDLSFNSLNGTIPSSIGSLTRLTVLDLSGNSFSGTIPSSIGSLTNLTDLDLSDNLVSGTIPLSIGSLTKLTELHLSYNYLLNGTCIPQQLGNLTNLQYLSLGGLTSCIVENIDWLLHMSDLSFLTMDGTSLAKADKLVNVILSLQKLSSLSLSGCDLSQVMHPYSSSFFNSSSSSIETLVLNDNNLNSSMYHWFLPLTGNNLHNLDLSNNMLDGKSFANLCSVMDFNFSYNSAVVNSHDFLNNWSGCTSVALQYLWASFSRFTGSLSDEIQMFSSLEYLHLDHNELNGSISEKVWELPKLQTLDISSNSLRDAISEKIGKSKIRDINLSNNSLNGILSETHMSNLSYVDRFDLSSCNVGPHFPKWIQKFKNLTQLNIADNRISDTIFVKFWNIWHSQLTYLNLSSNNISGEVPDLVSNFISDYAFELVIDLSSNNFYGHIPKVSSSVRYLDLSRNKFHGGISFLCQISGGHLTHLDLSRNSFTGKLPDCLQHFKELQVLNLGYNNLSGRLPASVESLISLEVLSLYNNNFSGELPLSLKSCTMLTFLDLGTNKFTGNVPTWIGESFPELYVLSLASNKLLGRIPLQLCQHANLQILDLSMNNLNGTIPSCLNKLTAMVQEVVSYTQSIYYSLSSSYPVFGTSNYGLMRVPFISINIYINHELIHWQGNIQKFSTNLGFLKLIDLSRNNLTGHIPYEITDLHGLVALNLSSNALHGKMPWKIGEMRNLLVLDISRNNLVGEIPSSITQMDLLSYLDVSYNNLSGRIPSSTQLQSFDPSSYTGNAKLCGPPLSKYCPGDEVAEVPTVVGETEDDGKERDDLQRWFNIGVATGFPIGFWIVCGTLFLNRRARHVFFSLSEKLARHGLCEGGGFLYKIEKVFFVSSCMFCL